MSTVFDNAAMDYLHKRVEASDENWFSVPGGLRQAPWYFNILARVLSLANDEEIVYLTSGVEIFSSDFLRGTILALTSKAVIDVGFGVSGDAFRDINSSVFLRSRISEVELVGFGDAAVLSDSNWKLVFVRDDGRRYALPRAVGHTNSSKEVAELFPRLLADMGNGDK